MTHAIKKSVFAFFLLLSILLGCNEVRACSGTVCNCDSIALSPAGLMHTHLHDKGKWMFAYTAMAMKMNGLSKENQNIDREEVFKSYLMSPISMKMNMHMIMLMYGLTDRFSLMLMANYNQANMTMEMASMPKHNHNSAMPVTVNNMSENGSGPGDMQLFIDYGIVKKQDLNLIGFFGLSLPTGASHKVNEQSMVPGQHLPYNMQLGTGSLDVIPGITVSTKIAGIQVGAQASAIFHNKINLQAWRYGDQGFVNLWLSKRIWKGLNPTFRSQASVSGPIIGQNPAIMSIMEPAADPVNYGSRTITIYPGIGWIFQNGLIRGSHLGLEFGKNMYANYNGIQSKSQWNAILNFTYSTN